MANRHLSRSIVLQTLFEWDFNGRNSETLPVVVERLTAEYAGENADLDFIRKLLYGVIEKVDALNDIIVKAAPDWPLDKISTVDRNILRIGLFELLFSDREEVPPKVAINEAIELAKGFGGDSSGRFVNGVLGAVYKEIGEPGKEETGKAKNKFNRSFEEMPVKRLCGAVVYAQTEEGIKLAFVHDVFGHWTLSKGHVQDGETEAMGAVRVVKEELALEAEVKQELGQNEYIASDPDLGKIRKQVTYFLAEAPFGELTLDTSGGLDEARWFALGDILDLNFYNDILPLITKTVTILKETS